MKQFEVCYCVKQLPYEDNPAWETYAYCDTVEEAREKYQEMKAIKRPGDYVDGTDHYIDCVAIFDTTKEEFIEKEW